MPYKSVMFYGSGKTDLKYQSIEPAESRISNLARYWVLEVCTALKPVNT